MTKKPCDLSPSNHQEEHIADKAIRPHRLADYIGQPVMQAQMDIFIPAALARQEALDHVLISGPPGLGKCITADSYILTDTGWQTLSTLIPTALSPDSYMTQHITVYGLHGLEKTSHIYYSGIQETLRLTTQAGFTLQGTLHHPILTATPQGLRWKPLRNISSNDWIAIARNKNIWGQPQPIEQINNTQALTALHRLHQFIKEKLFIPLKHFLHNPVDKYFSIAYPLAIFPHYRPSRQIVGAILGKMTQQLVQNKHARILATQALPCLPVTLTPELTYLIGVFIAKNSPSSLLNNLSSTLVAELCRLCQYLGYKVVYNQQAASFTLPSQISALFARLGLLSQQPACLPPIVLKSPAETVAACLRGLFDAQQIQASAPTLDTDSELLTSQVQLLLSNFGIIAHRAFCAPSYTLAIKGHNITLFYRIIGSQLGRANSIVHSEEDEIIPYGHCILQQWVQGQSTSEQQRHQAILSLTQLSRHQLVPYLNSLSGPEKDQLEILSDPDIYWDQMAQLEKGQTAVYDFCVPGSHAFVANGFYNHNTTLSHVIAHEMGVNLRQTSGPVLERAGDLAALLTNLEPYDVLFIDEIHRLTPVVEEILYPAMEDFQLDILIGEGPSARSVKIDLSPFTLIGATTRAGALTSPLRDRFGITHQLDFYAITELAQIIQRAAKILAIPLEPDAAIALAHRARGTPRIANRLLRRVRDYAQIRANGQITPTVVRQALDLLNIDERGLDTLDHKFLLTLLEKFAGGPTGIDSLATAIGEERSTLEDVVEPFLLQQGFIMRTPRGRLATALAWHHFNLNPKAAKKIIK